MRKLKPRLFSLALCVIFLLASTTWVNAQEFSLTVERVTPADSIDLQNGATPAIMPLFKGTISASRSFTLIQMDIYEMEETTMDIDHAATSYIMTQGDPKGPLNSAGYSDSTRVSPVGGVDTVFVEYLHLTSRTDLPKGVGVWKVRLVVQFEGESGFQFLFYTIGPLTSPSGDLETTAIRHPLPTLDFEVFPNPTTDILNLKNVTSEDCSIRVFDFQGKIIGLWKNAQQIDFSELPRGSYLIRIDDKKGFGIKKVFRQ